MWSVCLNKVSILNQKVRFNTVSILLYFSSLQEALITTKAEALRWQSLYEELKLSSGQLRENQLLSNEQLQQLHSQVEVQCGL